MASFTFTSFGQKYADGITLGAYPKTNWPTPYAPTGAPLGSSAATATFTDGAATFTGLTEGAEYWVVKTTTPYYYTSIQVQKPDGAAWLPDGVLLGSIIPRSGQLSNGATTSGQMRMTALDGKLDAGRTYSSIRLWSGITASSGLTHSWACLLDFDTSKVLRASADVTSEWLASTSRTFSFDTPYTPAEDIRHPGIGFVSVVSTTSPTVICDLGASSVLSQAPRITGVQNGFVTPSADGAALTPSASGLLLYAEVL